MTSVMQWVDGNDLAGAVGELLAGDLTIAEGRCESCGAQAMLAEARVFDRAPGLVARCSACDAVLLRIVHAPDRVWLDLRGLTYLQLRYPVTA